MKSLMRRGRIAVKVSQLDGYLQAVRDLNDDHSGNRYWFWANMVDIKNENVNDVIKRYLKDKTVTLKEIGLREELTIITSYIHDNYMQGTSTPDNQSENYIKHLHGWRIQEYMLMASGYDESKITGRWVVEMETPHGFKTVIFTRIKRKLVVMSFLKQVSQSS